MKRLLLLSVAATWGCDLVSGPEATDPLSEAEITTHLEFLAGDSLYGRGSASLYELQAAEYIRDEFAEYELEPGIVAYLQEFTIDAGQAGQLESRNVLGVLPGKGNLAGQWVVVGAHYDHLGFEAPALDSLIIYNGADDNASGTALLLEIARFLSHYYTAGAGEDDDRRAILFQAFGSEELGLLGSRHSVASPTVPLDSIAAMVNLDMVGRMAGQMVVVAGSGSSTLWPGLLDRVNDQNLSLVYDDRGLRRSDQYPYLMAGIPVLFFSTGLHDDWHRPTDDVWLLDTAGMAILGDLVLDVIANLTVWAERPTFAPR
jgi:Zn-dependent M28 family amino/carboxypeptidase